MPIRTTVSDILEVPIRSGRWVTYTDALDREGKFTRKTMIQIIMALCEEMEQVEFLTDRMASKLETVRDQLKEKTEELEKITPATETIEKVKGEIDPRLTDLLTEDNKKGEEVLEPSQSPETVENSASTPPADANVIPAEKVVNVDVLKPTLEKVNKEASSAKTPRRS